MSRNAKIALGVLAGLMFVCIGISAVGFFGFMYVSRNVEQFVDSDNFEEIIQTQIGEAVVSDPEAMQEMSAEIADFVLPVGYAEEQAFSMMGVNAVVYGNGNGGPTIAIAEIPASLVQGMEQQILELLSGNMGQVANFTDQEIPSFELLEERPIVLGGAETTLRVLEAGSDDNTIRQLNALYTGEGDMTNAVIIAGRMSTWNETEINEFLESMRGTGR